MRHGVWPVLLTSLGIAAVLFGAGIVSHPGFALSSVADAEEKKNDPPPLVVDRSEPLLLDKPIEEPYDPFGTPVGPFADNSACFVCHANYEEEPLSVEHSKANVSCVKCHGKSSAHQNDENNITPPDKLFAPEAVAASCEDCHDTHDAPAEKVIARWQERCPTKTKVEEIICTDCHGWHRLKIRTVRWDKKTRELIFVKKEDPGKAPPAGSETDKKSACGSEACKSEASESDAGKSEASESEAASPAAET